MWINKSKLVLKINLLFSDERTCSYMDWELNYNAQ